MRHPCPCCGQLIPADGALRVDDAGIVVLGGRFARLTSQEDAIFAALRAAGGGVFVV